MTIKALDLARFMAKIGHAFAEQLRRLEHQIVRSLAAVRRARPLGDEVKFGPGFKGEPVGAIAKRHCWLVKNHNTVSMSVAKRIVREARTAITAAMKNRMAACSA